MKPSLSALSAIGFLLLATPSNASASNQYALDDGSPNSGLSYGIPTDYCWFQSFTTVGTVDSITSVKVMWSPGGVPAGTLVRLCVWEDPNDDGDPSDAQLVTQIPGLVPSTPGFTYTTYALPAPALVHGGFFIGAALTTDGSFGAIALLDYNAPLAGRAWFATDAPGYFDPAQLSSSSYNHIEVLGAGIHGVFLLRAEGSGETPVVYCASKVNSLGCTPRIDFFGTPSVSAGVGFHVYATGVINRAPGLFVYGTSGRAALPFGGGTLCIGGPLLRTTTQFSGGTLVGVDCTGTYHIDFAAWIVNGGDPTLTAGTTVNAQYYSRDTGFAPPENIGLTDAIEFTLVP